MIARLRETRTHKVSSETVDGVNVMVFLKAANVNETIADTGHGDDADFDPTGVNITVELKRGNGDINIIASNLGVVGGYNTLIKNGFLWEKGVTTVQPDADSKHEVVRSCRIWFGGHINVGAEDELLVTINPTIPTFGVKVDKSDSFIQFETNQSQGVEVGIPQFKYYPIQAAQGDDTVQIGDNCLRAALLSFEKDPTKTIFTGCTLTSDRLDWTKNEIELLLKHFDHYNYNASEKYLHNLAITENPLYFPHSRMIYDGGGNEIDKAKVKFSMVSANVKNTKNYLCYTTYVTSADILDKALKMRAKHAKKDDEKIPLNLKTS